jgi:Uma2 family endonuclease
MGANILGADERVELVLGLVREMSPRKRPHVLATIGIRELLERELAGRASVYEEKPLALRELDSEPEPDIVVCSNPDVTAYGTDETEPLLVIEVADSSLQYDLTVKTELYARAGIPEYWVVDLVHRRLFVFREPKDGVFRSRTEHETDATVRPISWPATVVEISALFPPIP